MSDINKTVQAFEPLNGPGKSTVAVTLVANTSERVALPQPADGERYSQPTQFSIYNPDASHDAFVAFGDVTVTATAPTGATGASYPCPAGMVTTVTVGGFPAYVAAIGAGTQTLYITPGKGRA